MKRLEIEVSESIYDHILFFLNSLPKNLIHLSFKEENSTSTNKDTQLSQIKELLSKHQHTKPFENIKDPVAWQREIRDEWE